MPSPSPYRTPNRTATCRSPRPVPLHRPGHRPRPPQPGHAPVLVTRSRTPACSRSPRLRAVVAHHEALRFRLARDGGAWRLTVAETGDADLLRVVVDLAAVPRRRPRRRRARGRRRAQRRHGPGRRAAGARGALPRSGRLTAARRGPRRGGRHGVLVDPAGRPRRGVPAARRGRAGRASRRRHLPALGAAARRVRRYSVRRGVGVLARSQARGARPAGGPARRGEHPGRPARAGDMAVRGRDGGAPAGRAEGPRLPDRRGAARCCCVRAEPVDRRGRRDRRRRGPRRGSCLDDVDLARRVGWFTSVHRLHLHLPATGGRRAGRRPYASSFARFRTAASPTAWPATCARTPRRCSPHAPVCTLPLPSRPAQRPPRPDGPVRGDHGDARHAPRRRTGGRTSSRSTPPWSAGARS